MDSSNTVVVAILFLMKGLTSSTGGKVTTDCALSKDTMKLSYFGDARGVLAVNLADKMCFFTEDRSTATFELIVRFTDDGSEACYMDKKEDMKIFSITVQIRMTHKDFEDVKDEEFYVQCNFEPSASAVKSTADVDDSVSQPQIITEYISEKSNSTFVMTIVRADGTPFPGEIGMGRKLKLKVEMTASGNDVGFKATNCKASNPKETKTRLLMADGCGTGRPWDKTKGFTTTGLVGISPSFRMFRVSRRENVQFSCDFVICQKDCSGSSCTSSSDRRKRDAHSNTEGHLFHHEGKDSEDQQRGKGKTDSAEAVRSVTIINTHHDKPTIDDAGDINFGHQSQNLALVSEQGFSLNMTLNDVKKENDDDSLFEDDQEISPIVVRTIITPEKEVHRRVGVVVDVPTVDADTMLLLDLNGVDVNSNEGLPDTEYANSVKPDDTSKHQNTKSSDYTVVYILMTIALVILVVFILVCRKKYGQQLDS